MDRCICCGRELDYEGTLVCWACAKFGEGGNQHVAIHHTGGVCHRGGKMRTVDEANRKWQEYQAEGNSKANELTTMIANAKATIREQYPDEG